MPSKKQNKTNQTKQTSRQQPNPLPFKTSLSPKMPGNPPPHKKSQVLFNIQETAKLKETNIQTKQQHQ